MSKIFLSFLVGVVLLSSSVLVSATDVNVVNVVNLFLNSLSVTFTLQESNLTTVSVNPSFFIIQTPPAQKAVLMGPSSISFGVATECDIAGKSKITVPENVTLTITPLQPAVTDAEFLNTCDGRHPGSGALVVVNPPSGGGGGGGGGGGNPPPVTTVVQPQPKALLFTDIPGMGTKKLDADFTAAIYSVAQVMVDAKTYIVPKNQKFGPNAMTSSVFALQVSLAVAGKNCGKTIGLASCKAAAIKAGIITKKTLTKNLVNRKVFYGMLIKAAGIPMADKSSVTADNLCTDVKVSSKDALGIATARLSGIATLYAGNKCNANSTFKKSEAMVFAFRAIAATKQQ